VSALAQAERERLQRTFAQLCAIESPSGRERACADRVASWLSELGLEVHEDASGPAAGSDAGNLLARIPGRSQRSILLCAHLDTVPLAAPVAPQLRDGVWSNANEGILGADNKAAVAVLVELARRLTAAGEPPPVSVELLFCVCEEVSLRGSAQLDAGALRSSFGFIFDHASPVGEVVVASPTHYRIQATVRGRAAHAGVRPEQGRSAIAAAARAIAAMRLGRLDAQTTANVGQIEGGSAINVVPERCRLLAEARSLDDARASAVATEIVDRLQDAADAAECDLDVEVERTFSGYRLGERDRQLAVAERALRSCGHTPRRIQSAGASDANSLIAAGLPCVCLADGVQANHEPGERVARTIEDVLEIALEIVEQSAAELCEAPSR